MFKYIFLSVQFFCMGAVVASYLSTDYFSDLEEVEFSIESQAALTMNACPHHKADNLLGRWKGHKTLPDGTEQEWFVDRKGDGTYKIDFILESPSGIEKSQETGLWAYSYCLYSVVTKAVNETPIIYQEVYRLLELDTNKMTYTNFRTGNTFTLQKVAI